MNDTILNNYQRWTERAIADVDVINELKDIAENEEKIEDAFYKDLAFGTGGLRGVIGAGTNRLNVYTVRQPISYLFPAIIITMAGVLVFKIYKKGKGRIRFSCILFIIYIEILMQTAFFSREPGSRQQIDLNLFGTWGQTAIAHAYFIENIIMFIPFGLLAPMVFERMRKVRFCVFIGFLCSCGIELSQLITQRGYCQLDDVVTNTVGMLVGWGIWKMLSSVGIAGNPLF